ncbi:bifunctional 4-hydroxy-2-oxoglutarate aldolase/2-dehydro-3-deoxy-phosphogluconate aldolase [Paenarthrobacter nicotinovorans]|uniref:bifunctional 4-hydroxy-2-oxoglutarate aldolase/2-dehydro-3-deoxy-phosphogluconate aldolase n=1 Tax=Paenarthrobacter nicotinovorans TaxID=29320 RepID=UPI00382398CA
MSFEGITAVLRASTTRHLVRVIDTLVTEGITSVELTLTTPGVQSFLEQEASRWQKVASIGVGTVLTVEQAEKCLDAGAEFLVTPALRPAVSAVAVARQTPIGVGAMTPTEVLSAHEAGASIVKIFPAATVSPDYLAHLRGPMPWLRAMPSGGIRLEQIPAWVSAGAVGVSLGSPLLGDSPDTGDTSSLVERARRAKALLGGEEL